MLTAEVLRTTNPLVMDGLRLYAGLLFRMAEYSLCRKACQDIVPMLVDVIHSIQVVTSPTMKHAESSLLSVHVLCARSVAALGLRSEASQLARNAFSMSKNSQIAGSPQFLKMREQLCEVSCKCRLDQQLAERGKAERPMPMVKQGKASARKEQAESLVVDVLVRLAGAQLSQYDCSPFHTRDKDKLLFAGHAFRCAFTYGSGGIGPKALRAEIEKQPWWGRVLVGKNTAAPSATGDYEKWVPVEFDFELPAKGKNPLKKKKGGKTAAAKGGAARADKSEQLKLPPLVRAADGSGVATEPPLLKWVLQDCQAAIDTCRASPDTDPFAALGWARVLFRLHTDFGADERVLKLSADLYRGVLATAVGATLHDAAIELGDILANHKPCQNRDEAISVYSDFLRLSEARACPERATTSTFDDGFIYGELCRLLFIRKRFKMDLATLEFALTGLMQNMGVGSTEEYISLLCASNLTSSCKKIFKNATSSHTANELDEFFRARGW